MTRWSQIKTLRRGVVQQTDDPNCTFLAKAAGELQYRRRNRRTSNGRLVQTFSVRFFDEQDGEVWTRVRRRIKYHHSGIERGREAVDETLFRGYIKFKAKHDGLSRKYMLNHGMYEDEVMEDITGERHRIVWYDEPDTLINNAQPGDLIGTFTDNSKFIYGHAYRVIEVRNDGMTLFNPWKSDGPVVDGIDDGYVSLSKGDILNDPLGYRLSAPIARGLDEGTFSFRS